jgi:hypothetical protein
MKYDSLTLNKIADKTKIVNEILQSSNPMIVTKKKTIALPSSFFVSFVLFSVNPTREDTP